MNTKAIQEQIAQLKTADYSAYKAGTKSNFLLNFVRNELIKRAFKASTAMDKETTVDMSMTVLSYVAPSLALLSKSGQYPALFTNAEVKFVEGECKFVYTINAEGLSNEYRAKLNENLGINLAIEAPVEEVV